MPEIRSINTQHMDQKCPACGTGYMRPNGIVHQTVPPTFEHKCEKCRFTATYSVRYPYSLEQ